MDLNDLDVCISMKQVSLMEASPGICVDESCNVIFKTEYSEEDSEGNYRPICYNRAGERWHGNYNKWVRNMYIE